jgi:hypothetical protein
MIVLVYFLWEPQLHPNTLKGTSEIKSEWSRINPWSSQSGGASSFLSEGTSATNQFNFTNGNVPVGDDDALINFMMAPTTNQDDNNTSSKTSSFGQRVYETFRPAATDAAAKHKNPFVVPKQNSKFDHSAAVMFQMEESFLESKFENATTIPPPPSQNKTAVALKKLNTAEPTVDKLLAPTNSTKAATATQNMTTPSNSTRRWLRTAAQET